MIRQLFVCLLMLALTGCATSNKQGLLEIELDGKGNSWGTQKRLVESFYGSLGEDTSLEVRSVVDQRVYADRLGANIKNTDFIAWTERVLNSWVPDLSAAKKSLYCTIEVEKAYFRHVSTSFKAVVVMNISVRQSNGTVLLSDVYRGSEVDVNYISAKSEYAGCMRAAIEEAWLNFLGDVSKLL